MRPGIQSRPGRVLVVAFAVGAVAGFWWGLLRPHPASAYRASLSEQRQRLLRERAGG